jgi:hypothetical protein
MSSRNLLSSMSKATVVVLTGLLAAHMGPTVRGPQTLEHSTTPFLKSAANRSRLVVDMKQPIALSGQLNPVQYYPQGMSNRCITPSGICFIPGYLPVGSGCACATPYGPIYGRIG